MLDRTEKFASIHLGKKSSGSELYDKSLLVCVPRLDNRSQYGIKNESLPFNGFDIWHAYEFSSLTKNGIPVTRLLKIKYPCNNDYIIESKSLKLYLNSYNMTKFGETINECLEICTNMIQKDLSEKLCTEVKVNFIDNNTPRTEIFKNYVNIMNFVDEKTLKAEHYKETPSLLQTTPAEEKEYRLMFDSLRSNCRVTHQPDFGDVFIYYKSTKHIIESSIVQYLTSFRSEYHFHEECVEMIYKRLYDVLDKEDKLIVCALYTRRGGIDICPARWNNNCTPADVQSLINPNIFARNGVKQ